MLVFGVSMLCELVPSECQYIPTSPHGIRSQKTNIATFTAMRTSNLILCYILLNYYIFNMSYDFSLWHVSNTFETLKFVLQNYREAQHSCNSNFTSPAACKIPAIAYMLTYRESVLYTRQRGGCASIANVIGTMTKP
jgi:hypothetical protein